MEQEMEQETGQERPEAEGQPEHNDVLERIVYNAMKIIGGERSSHVQGMLDSGQSAGEGLSTAITFVLQGVIGGLQKKGVEIPPELIMSENGAASQITQLLVALIGASGKDITPNEIQQAMDVGISNFGTKQRSAGKEQPQQGQQPEQPPQQPPQQPQQAPPQQGLIAGGL